MYATIFSDELHFISDGITPYIACSRWLIALYRCFLVTASLHTRQLLSQFTVLVSLPHKIHNSIQSYREQYLHYILFAITALATTELTSFIIALRRHFRRSFSGGAR